MRHGNARDPLLLEVLPTGSECLPQPSHYTADPLQEAGRTSGGIMQKYAGRVLLHLLAACPIHCRYCFRRHHQVDNGFFAGDWRTRLGNLGEDIGEVILSGGDPLMLKDDQLAEVIDAVQTQPQITTLRLHTRMPVAAPQRITPQLLEVLTNRRLRTVVVLHCNHAQALDQSARTSLLEMHRRGITLLNQAVLLRSVNDDVQSLLELSHGLFACGVLPYYLHKLDPVAGAAHFDVGVDAGKKLVAKLRDALPGYLVPRFVVEEPGGSSKTDLL